MKPQSIVICLALAATATANPVGTINGHPVSEQEYRVFSEQEKPMVISYFIRTHGAVQSPSFWNNAWGGELPTKVLAERVVRKIARTRVIQELGIEYGMCRQVKSYDDFMAELQEVNAQRRKWVDENRVIYGPIQYKPDFYVQMQLDQIFSAVSKKLENAPEADRLVSDTEARAYYQRNKDDRYASFEESRRRIIELLTRERLEAMTTERIGLAKVEGFDRLESIGAR